MSSYGKSVQFEEMTGRENQFGALPDRPLAGERKTDVNLGLRYENYPLMHVPTAASRCSTTTRSTSRSAASAAIQGPRDQGQQDAVRAASRRGLPRSTTTPCSVPATAGRSTRCRGRGRCADAIPRRSPTATPAPTASCRMAPWPPGIPGSAQSGHRERQRPAAARRRMRSPDPNNVERGTIALLERLRGAPPAARHRRSAPATSAPRPTTATRTST